MSRALDDLSPEMKLKSFELIARCAEAGILLCVIDTLRTKAEQEANIKKGVSWTMNSRHLANACGKSEAVDVVPYQTFTFKGKNTLIWDAENPVWKTVGEIGESIGLVWGGRWKQKDMGHFELKRQK